MCMLWVTFLSHALETFFWQTCSLPPFSPSITANRTTYILRLSLTYWAVDAWIQPFATGFSEWSTVSQVTNCSSFGLVRFHYKKRISREDREKIKFCDKKKEA